MGCCQSTRDDEFDSSPVNQNLNIRCAEETLRAPLSKYSIPLEDDDEGDTGPGPGTRTPQDAPHTSASVSPRPTVWSATDIDPFTGTSIADYETLTAPLVDGAGDAAADAGNDTVVTLRRSTSPDEQPGPPTPVSPPLPAAFKFAARNSRMNFGEDSEDELEAARPLSPRRSFSYAEALETTPIAITTTDATDATPTPASPLSPASPGFDTIKRKTGAGNITRNHPGLRLSMALSKELKTKIGPPKNKRRPHQKAPYKLSVPSSQPAARSTGLGAPAARGAPMHAATHTARAIELGEGPGYVLAASDDDVLPPAPAGRAAPQKVRRRRDSLRSEDGFMSRELEPESGRVADLDAASLEELVKTWENEGLQELVDVSVTRDRVDFTRVSHDPATVKMAALRQDQLDAVVRQWESEADAIRAKLSRQ